VFTDEQQRQPNHNTQYVVVLWLGLLLLSSVSKHNMWSYYDWVVRGQQRQPNHNTTTYSVYWRTKTTINPIIIRSHCMLICGRIMIGLSLFSSVSKHNMWSYYDWDNNDNPIIIRPHIVFTDGRRQSNNITTTYCVYWRTTTQSYKHNMWWYYGWVCRCRLSVSITCGITIGFIIVFVR
jgi:hypothetical protein